MPQAKQRIRHIADTMSEIENWNQSQAKMNEVFSEKLKALQQERHTERDKEKERKLMSYYLQFEESITKIQRYYRFIVNLRKFQRVVDDAMQVKEKIFKAEHKRYNIIKEIIETERIYVKSLQLLVSVSEFHQITTQIIQTFMVPFRAIVNVYITPQDMFDIFSNVEILLQCHETFLRELEEEELMQGTKLGQTFLHFVSFVCLCPDLEQAPFFKLYSQYVNNYQNSVATRERCMLIPAFKSFATVCSRC